MDVNPEWLYPGPSAPDFDLSLFLNDVTAPGLLRISLDIALEERGVAVLVWRADTGPLLASATALLDVMQPYQVSERLSREWHGTTTSGGPATIREFSVVPEVYAALLKVGSFLHFRPPQYPEDLAFGNERRRIWIFTTPHERYCSIATKFLSEAQCARIAALLKQWKRRR